MSSVDFQTTRRLPLSSMRTVGIGLIALVAAIALLGP